VCTTVKDNVNKRVINSCL